MVNTFGPKGFSSGSTLQLILADWIGQIFQMSFDCKFVETAFVQ